MQTSGAELLRIALTKGLERRGMGKQPLRISRKRCLASYPICRRKWRLLMSCAAGSGFEILDRFQRFARRPGVAQGPAKVAALQGAAGFGE
jgi:hypothetical protein